MHAERTTCRLVGAGSIYLVCPTWFPDRRSSGFHDDSALDYPVASEVMAQQSDTVHLPSPRSQKT